MERTFVLSDATIWRPDPVKPVGHVERGSLLVRDGRLESVGAGPLPEGLPVVEAGGRLVTPGLVDCHTHPGFARRP